MEEEKSEEKTSTADKQKESLKRKLDEAQATDSAKPEKKKNKKKKKKKKKSQKVQDKAKSNEIVVEEAAKEVSKKPEKEAEAVIEKPTEEQPAEDKSAKETPTKAKDGKESKTKSKKSKKVIKAGKGVTYRVLKKGKAGFKPAKEGDSITLLYVGCLKDGTQFDKNLKDGLTFKIGGEEVIPGIELGIMGMCPKEKRRIIIPSEQGYGEDGASEGKIPPNAELHFTVQRK